MQKASLKNDTILSSLAWRLHTNFSFLWVKVLNLKYNTNHESRKPSSYKIWRDILRGWNLCKDAILWSVHDGKRVDVWRDRWISNHPPLCNIIQGTLPNTNPLGPFSLILEFKEILFSGPLMAMVL